MLGKFYLLREVRTTTDSNKKIIIRIIRNYYSNDKAQLQMHKFITTFPDFPPVLGFFNHGNS